MSRLLDVLLFVGVAALAFSVIAFAIAWRVVLPVIGLLFVFGVLG